MKETTNYKLKKPDLDEYIQISDLNDNADVIDAQLKENATAIENVEIPVTSVNDKTGEVTITKEDVGLGNLTNDKQATEVNFNTHKEDETVHGIGDKSTLKTTEKSTIVGAVNELFTDVSDGKQLIGGAITDVDEEVDVPTDATFEQLADAIGKIETGKGYASGSMTIPDAGQRINVTGLKFVPRMVYMRYTKHSSINYATLSTLPTLGAIGHNAYLNVGNHKATTVGSAVASMDRDGFSYEVGSNNGWGSFSLHWDAWE